jgi:hypothetical protein
MIRIFGSGDRHLIADVTLDDFDRQLTHALESRSLLRVTGPETGIERVVNPFAVFYAEPDDDPESDAPLPTDGPDA